MKRPLQPFRPEGGDFGTFTDDDAAEAVETVRA